jgi:hypothetical protein
MSSIIALPFYNVQTANSFTYAAANLNPLRPRNTYYPVGITGLPNYAKTALQYNPRFTFYPTFNPYPQTYF